MKRNLPSGFDKFPLQSAYKGLFTSSPMILNNIGALLFLNKSMFLDLFRELTCLQKYFNVLFFFGLKEAAHWSPGIVTYSTEIFTE